MKIDVRTFKYLVAYLFIVIASTFTIMSSCTPKHDPNLEKDIKHELRKFNVKDVTSKYVSASFFIAMGSYHSGESTRTTARFYFKNCIGEYQFMEINQSQLRIVIDSVKTPYVTFEQNKFYRSYKCYEHEFDTVQRSLPSSSVLKGLRITYVDRSIFINETHWFSCCDSFYNHFFLLVLS